MDQREPGSALDRPPHRAQRGPDARPLAPVPDRPGRGGGARGHAEGYADTFKQHFRAFYGYVEKGDFSATPPFATFKDGHREVVLCEAVLESHRKGGWVDVKGT